ncbi:MAG: hypothetical protein ABSG43_24980 [Solirubrobacteraceae bacterium]
MPQLRYIGSVVRHRPGVTTVQLGDLDLSESLYRCGRHDRIARESPTGSPAAGLHTTFRDR